jgi:alpha-L-fucosidase
VYDGSEKCVFEGTVVGYKKIVLLDETKTKELIKELVIEIIDSRIAPTLSYIGIFE